MRGLYGESRIWLKLVQFARDPNDTPKVFQLIDLMLEYRSADYFRTMLQTSFASTELEEQFVSGYVPSIPTLYELGGYPPGSLGKLFQEHMNRYDLDVDFYPHLDRTHPVKYIIYRHYVIHDLLHVLLGYDTSIAGELAIQGFTQAQLASPVTAMIIAAALLHTATKEPQNLANAMTMVCEGYERGRRSKPLLAAPIDRYLHLPLATARSLCGIEGAGQPSPQPVAVPTRPRARAR